MDVLELSNKIENKLKENNLVGERIGSGFYFPTGERDVQYEYNPKNINKEAITAIVERTAKLNHAKSRIKFSDEWFSFYVSCSPKLE